MPSYQYGYNLTMTNTIYTNSKVIPILPSYSFLIHPNHKTIPFYWSIFLVGANDEGCALGHSLTLWPTRPLNSLK
jgi:hypothetical protein